jgi:hypothetical protein
MVCMIHSGSQLSNWSRSIRKSTKSKPVPTQDILKEWFDYHEDGYLIWKKCKANWIKVGEIAGSEKGNGYRTIGFLGRKYLSHRLIFMWHKGYCPDLIDHRDQNPTNSRIENLRPSDKKYNTYNAKMWSHNTSGYRGVSMDRKTQKWVARFKHKNRYEFLGYFETKERAHEARLERERSCLNV